MNLAMLVFLKTSYYTSFELITVELSKLSTNNS